MLFLTFEALFYAKVTLRKNVDLSALSVAFKGSCFRILKVAKSLTSRSVSSEAQESNLTVGAETNAHWSEIFLLQWYYMIMILQIRNRRLQNNMQTHSHLKPVRFIFCLICMWGAFIPNQSCTPGLNYVNIRQLNSPNVHTIVFHQWVFSYAIISRLGSGF